ncbi:MAG: hypothetical protein LDLANPLL_01528 [Turneriella sp.]|nr:hypothetical protein [Turneriella sp.]
MATSMKSILITQCLQNDFVRPLDRYDPLPNLLHVGYDEANRLLGERVEEGPVAKIIRWAYAQPSDALQIIHIRDWHDETDSEQNGHLMQFGKHCLKNSTGASFVFEHLIREDREHAIVDASGLNDFYKTNLETYLKDCEVASTKVNDRDVINGSAASTVSTIETKVRVGIIGVWTEAKITYLAYELLTRYPAIELVTCSALTASSSRSAHFIALDQLKKILGVKIFDSVGSFAEYLGGANAAPVSVSLQGKMFDDTKFHFNIPYSLQPADNRILHYLFRESTSADFLCLDGGFSGNVVLKATAKDSYGQSVVPTVVKIGERDSIARERAAFERVQEVLGNSAPAIVDFAESDARGGIKYRYAAMTDGNVKTFQKYFAASDDVELLVKFLKIVFTKQLGRFYDAAVQESLNLLEYYDFNPKYANSVRKKSSELAEKTSTGRLKIVDGLEVEDVAEFYEHELVHLRETVAMPRYVSWLHGDLNGANIIIDEAQNVWLIDFFHTHRGHALKDFIKLENDILFIFTKIESESDLHLAVQATDWLFSTHNLAESLGEIPAALAADARFNKSLKIIRYLRSLYSGVVKLDRDPYQFFVAAARYAIHTLSFDECNLWQRKWALYAGAKAIARVREALTQSAHLRINFLDIQGNASDKGLIGLTILPGRKDRGRDIDVDITALKEANVKAIVPLITANEFLEYGVENLLEKYTEAQFDILHIPIKDQGVPTVLQVEEVLAFIKKHTDAKKRVVIHCVGGLGRTGVVVALYLRRFAGLDGDEAIYRVRAARSPRAVENLDQENFVRNYMHRLVGHPQGSIAHSALHDV